MPLTTAALDALALVPEAVRFKTPYVFGTARRAGLFDVDSFRRREWGPAVD